MKPQFSHDNPGWQGPGVPTARALIASAYKKIAVALVRLELRVAWHVFQGFIHDIYYFHLNSKAVRVKCPCCGWTGPAFLSAANWRAVTINSRCPSCDSRSRHRGLAILLPKLLESLPGDEVLYFAPEKMLLEEIRHLPYLKIFTTDLNSVDVDCTDEDIQKLSFTPGRFGALICNHVLEHVPNDQAAIAECARVLKARGLAIFTIPGDYPNQTTREYKSPDRNGHRRHYGMDVLDKLEPFFEVQPLDMHELTSEEFKVRTHDYVFVCNRKQTFV